VPVRVASEWFNSGSGCEIAILKLGEALLTVPPRHEGRQDTIYSLTRGNPASCQAATPPLRALALVYPAWISLAA
jgi:hypothetical protein